MIINIERHVFCFINACDTQTHLLSPLNILCDYSQMVLISTKMYNLCHIRIREISKLVITTKQNYIRTISMYTHVYVQPAPSWIRLWNKR